MATHLLNGGGVHAQRLPPRQWQCPCLPALPAHRESFAPVDGARLVRLAPTYIFSYTVWKAPGSALIMVLMLLTPGRQAPSWARFPAVKQNGAHPYDRYRSAPLMRVDLRAVLPIRACTSPLLTQKSTLVRAFTPVNACRCPASPANIPVACYGLINKNYPARSPRPPVRLHLETINNLNVA